MGRLVVILGIWIAGFSLGFIGYLAYPMLSQMAVSIIPALISLDSQMIGAIVAGMASSFLTVLAVSLWAYASRSTNSI